MTDYESKITEGRRKKNTVIFTLITSVCNVILTLLLMMALLAAFIFICYKILRLKSSLAIQIAMPVILIGSLILDFFLSIKLIKMAIIKFNLQDTINKKVADQYLYGRNHRDKNTR